MPDIGSPIIGTRLKQECVLDVVVVEWNTGTGTAAYTGFDERQKYCWYVTVRGTQEGAATSSVILEREREKEREGGLGERGRKGEGEKQERTKVISKVYLDCY